VLASDRGVRGVVIINRARLLKFDSQAEKPTVHAETGVTPMTLPSERHAWGWLVRMGCLHSGSLAERCMAMPGLLTAHGWKFDLGGSVPRQHGRQTWPMDKLEYGYRTSLLNVITRLLSSFRRNWC